MPAHATSAADEIRRRNISPPLFYVAALHVTIKARARSVVCPEQHSNTLARQRYSTTKGLAPHQGETYAQTSEDDIVAGPLAVGCCVGCRRASLVWRQNRSAASTALRSRS